MADISYRTGTPDTPWAFPYGIAMLIVPIQDLYYTISSVTIPFAHRDNSPSGHGPVTTIGCYIAAPFVLGTSDYPPSLVEANNSFLSTDFYSYPYGTWDGTYRLQTFTFTESLRLTGQNWIVLTHTEVNVEWSLTHMAGFNYNGGTSNGAGSGRMRIRAKPGGSYEWQPYVNPTARAQYIDVDGSWIPAGSPDVFPNFPNQRPDDYDPDAIWTPSEEPYTNPEWQDPGFSNYQAAGGGRWGQQLVVAGKGLVYYESRE